MFSLFSSAMAMRFNRSKGISQIDFPLADGFSYVSGHTPAFASQQLLAFSSSI
jgi:hypothetical protein